MHKVVILGSTGSLGRQTLEVLGRYRNCFEIAGLSAGKNTRLLKRQAKNLKNISLGDLPDLKNADIVVNAISGIAGIEPTLEILKLGKILLLGNKESLVAEGKRVLTLLAENLSAQIIPLDSEHNAIYEILQKFPAQKPQKIILPCSGGPFLNRKDLENVTPEEAVRHPKWQMGAKISLESATLINKGLEILEAHHLFGIPVGKIEVKIHPQCLMHGAVQFENGQTIGYFAKPDMREHIENALLRAVEKKPPKRDIRTLWAGELDLPDPPKHLPGIQTVLNAKRRRNFLKKEEAVLRQFLDREIAFPEIFTLLEKD